MCLVILFGGFLPHSQGCTAAAGPQERGEGGQAPAGGRLGQQRSDKPAPAASQCLFLEGEETQGSGAWNLKLFP